MEKWIDGSQYYGEYVKGAKEGLGIYGAPDGSVYAGEWVAN